MCNYSNTMVSGFAYNRWPREWKGPVCVKNGQGNVLELDDGG